MDVDRCARDEQFERPARVGANDPATYTTRVLKVPVASAACPQ